MTLAALVGSRPDLLQSLSVALRTTPVMVRLHDPDHALADATARQLVASLQRLGITVTMAAAEPLPGMVAP